MSRVQWRANGESMFGWRKRIGYIAPTVIEVVAYEFYQFAPDGIGLTGVTCNIDDWRPDEFEKGLAQVAAAATYLGSRGVDFIIHGGGPLVVARGAGYEDMIVRDVEAAAKVKATTSIRAGMEALRRIKANTIEKRLQNSRGEPNFNINFYILNAKGEYAGVTLYPGPRGQKFAVCDEKGARLETCEPLLQGSPE